MPFEIKFRAMMDMPLAGDHLGSMTVESVTVGHEGRSSGVYAYPLRLVLRGSGGLAAGISNYFCRDAKTFDYTVTGMNEYYLSILSMADQKWPGGLRWLHEEDKG